MKLHVREEEERPRARAIRITEENGEEVADRAPASMEEAAAKPGDLLVNVAFAPGSDRFSLRNSLRDNVGDTSPSRHRRGSKDDEDDDESSYIGLKQFAPLGAPQSGLTDLKPLNTSGVMMTEDKEPGVRELTIFDVVHRKYQEKEFLGRLFRLSER